MPSRWAISMMARAVVGASHSASPHGTGSIRWSVRARSCQSRSTSARSGARSNSGGDDDHVDIAVIARGPAGTRPVAHRARRLNARLTDRVKVSLHGLFNRLVNHPIVSAAFLRSSATAAGVGAGGNSLGY